MGQANDGSDSHSSPDSDGRESIDAGTENHTQPTRIRLKNGDMEVKASSHDEDAEKLARIVSAEMERMEKQRLIGEYQMLEEKEFHSILLGGE